MKVPKIQLLIILFLFVFASIHAGERKLPALFIKFKPHTKDTTLKHTGLEKLPLLRFNSKNDSANYFVILFPGDGGWRDVMNTVTKGLNQRGVDVVGFNTLPYFRKKKSPAQIAFDIQRVMEHYMQVWGKKYVVLGGYSFSAEMLPFAYNAMDTKFQARILQIILLAPSHLADFKVGTLFIYPTSHSTPLLPELQKIDPNKMLIICDGVKESICRSMPYENPFNIVFFKCNHWFVGYKKEVAQVITEQLGVVEQSLQ
jgi:type IV secretory pathway VirJ component